MKLYLFHYIVDALWTAFRSLHSVSFFYMFDHISKWYSRIRNPTEWVDFPQKYSEAPHITLAWELLGLQSLRSSPFNGQLKREESRFRQISTLDTSKMIKIFFFSLFSLNKKRTNSRYTNLPNLVLIRFDNSFILGKNIQG